MNLIKIDDFNDPGLDIYARMSETELMHIYEPDVGLFIAESPKVIERALNAGYEPVSFLACEDDIDGEIAGVLARYMELRGKCKDVPDITDIPIYTAGMDILTKLTGFRLTRGALCAMRRKKLLPAETVCDGARRVAVLENVMNPTNVGAIFRSAAALGIDAVLLTAGCSNPLYRRAVRVSMGTVFQVPWTFIGNGYLKNDIVHNQSESNVLIDKGLTEKENKMSGKSLNNILHELGFATASMALCENSVSISETALKREERLAIILGTEGEGLLDTTIKESDYTVKIPMSHGVDSLNVAAASAVAFWELTNRV